MKKVFFLCALACAFLGLNTAHAQKPKRPIGSVTECAYARGTIQSLDTAFFPSIKLGTVMIVTGAGSPEGVVPAPVGSMFLRTNGSAGTSHYIKETGTGNTGWVPK